MARLGAVSFNIFFAAACILAFVAVLAPSDTGNQEIHRALEEIIAAECKAQFGHSPNAELDCTVRLLNRIERGNLDRG